MSSEYVHDPNAVLDYIVDWSKWLRKNETITATNFAVFGGVDLDSSSNTATLTVAWVSGGTEGTVAGCVTVSPPIRGAPTIERSP